MASKPAKKTAPAKKKKQAAEKASESPHTGLKFLNVGCGMTRKENTTKGFNTPEWHEVRLDIEKSVSPDIVASMADMSSIEANSFDAVFAQHSIQHLHVHEVPLAFAEFLRVLKPDGFAVISCPDLQSASALVAQNKLTAPLYNSPAGHPHYDLWVIATKSKMEKPQLEKLVAEHFSA